MRDSEISQAKLRALGKLLDGSFVKESVGGESFALARENNAPPSFLKCARSLVTGSLSLSFSLF
jgi:hypothetical protein